MRINTPATFTPKTYSPKFGPDHEADPTSKTEASQASPKESETQGRLKVRAWRTGSKIILISFLVAVVTLVPLIYLVFKKTRKRPVNVFAFPRHATQAGMTGSMPMNPLATADPGMQQGSAAYNSATAMERGAGRSSFKAPGTLPPYYALEFGGEVKERMIHHQVMMRPSIHLVWPRSSSDMDLSRIRKEWWDRAETVNCK